MADTHDTTRDVLGSLAVETRWNRDEGIGPYRMGLIATVALSAMAGTAFYLLSLTGASLMSAPADEPQVQSLSETPDEALSPDAPTEVAEETLDALTFTRLEAVPEEAPDAPAPTEDVTGLALAPVPEPKSAAGLVGDSEGLRLPALRLSLDDTAIRELLASGQVRALVRERNGAVWSVHTGHRGLDAAVVSGLDRDDGTLGQRQIAISPARPVSRALETIVRNAVVVPGKLSFAIVFTRSFDEALIAEQRDIAERYASEIAAYSESGGTPSITGCWTDGRIALARLTLGANKIRLVEPGCE